MIEPVIAALTNSVNPWATEMTVMLSSAALSNVAFSKPPSLGPR